MDFDVFNSFSGDYEFNPATLIQRRPSYQRENPLLDGQFSLHHERAHWFQFAGSTIGIALLTLHRAEEVALLRGFSHGNLDHDSAEYIRHCLRSDRPIWNTKVGQAQKLPTPRLQKMVCSFLGPRTARILLTDSLDRDRPGNRPTADLIVDAFVTIDDVYAIHTGNHRPWGRTRASDIYREGSWDVTSALIGESEVTTRHVFEASAFVNQWSTVAVAGWREGRLRPGQAYTSLPSSSRYILTDAIAALPERYRLCLDIALQCWRTHLGDSDGEVGEHFARAFPTLACCFDIAINPPIVPVCEPVSLGWEEIYPPFRFLSAVAAVRKTGLIEEFPGSASYATFRGRICREAAISIGTLHRRSFQHERFSEEFFTTAEVTDPLVSAMSYFDYILWAAESFSEFRRDDPLRWAMPWINNYRFEGRDVTEHWMGKLAAATTTPLFWSGDEFGWGPLSTPIAHRIALEKCFLYCLKESVTRSGVIDLTSVFPLELLRYEGFTGTVVTSLAKQTGIAEFTQRSFMFDCEDDVDLQDTAESKDSSSPRIRGIRREIFSVHRDEVKALDFSRLGLFLEERRLAPLENVRSIDLHFESYNAISEGLWNIQEVRTYIQSFHARFPYWPWYLTAGTDLTRCAGLVLIFLSGLDDYHQISDKYALQWMLEVTGDPLVQEGERVGAGFEFLKDLTADVADSVIAIMKTSFR